MTIRPDLRPGDEHDDHGGLHRDVPALVGRRDMLRIMGGMSLAGLLAACGVGSVTTTTQGGSGPTPTGAGASTTTQAGSTTTTGNTAGEEIPDETAGPFPADGSNGPNVLDDEGVVRSDLTASFGGSSGTADGMPIRFNLSIVDASNGGALPGAVVYLWHCTAEGRYSIYEIEDQNYLRGVQVADDAGRIGFTSIFPGCYAGRWPHAHFEVYGSLEEATAGSAAIKTSQLALPQADCETVYADSRYGTAPGTCPSCHSRPTASSPMGGPTSWPPFPDRSQTDTPPPSWYGSDRQPSPHRGACSRVLGDRPAGQPRCPVAGSSLGWRRSARSALALATRERIVPIRVFITSAASV